MRSKVICVLGMHRSGTSAISRVINISGAYIGEEADLLEHNKYNPKGFWEYQAFVEINDSIFKHFGSSWDSINEFPNEWWTLAEIVPYKEKLKQVIAQKFGSQPVWVFKDPRTCVLLPLWNSVFEEMNLDVEYIIAVRNPLDIVQSLLKRDGYSFSRSIGLWAYYMQSALFWTANYNRMFISYDDFLENTSKYVDIFMSFTDSTKDGNEIRQEVSQFIDKDLRHSKSDPRIFLEDQQYPSNIRRLFELLLELCHSTEPINLTYLEEANQIYYEFWNQYHIWAETRTRINSQCQLFYASSEHEAFQEELSIRLPILEDNKFNDFEFTVPKGYTRSMRIDPTNSEGIVIIKSIEAYSIGDNSHLLKSWAGREIYEHIDFKMNIRIVTNEHELLCLSLNNDPYFSIRNFLSNVEHGVSLKIRMAHYRLTKDTVNFLVSKIDSDEETIAVLRAAMKEQEFAIHQLNEELSIKEERLKEKDTLLKESEEKLHKLIAVNQKQMEEIDEIMVHLEQEQDKADKLVQEVSNQSLQIRHLQHELWKSSSTLTQIYNSNGWRMLTLYYNWRNKLLPVGSNRRRVIRALWNIKFLIKQTNHHIRTYGVKATIVKIRNKVRPLSNRKVSVPVLQFKKASTANVNYDFSKSSEASVSVIIPTFNGGQDFRLILKMIKRQKGFKNIEIIVVDSGSTDQTVTWAREVGARIITITQEEFSHSFARNLGAENASYEYLMIMTQDALPISDYWLFELFTACELNQLVAASCAESSRESADLFYRIICWSHYRFLGALDKDRVMSLPSSLNYNDLRFNAQLSDVACFLRKDIFMKYKYRFDYAEDLDLGLRLIRDGHKIGLLGQTKVIHSHDRPPYYHLKRGFVDNLFMHNLFEDFTIQTIHVDNIKRDLIYTYNVVFNITETIGYYSINSIDDLRFKTIELLDRAINSPYSKISKLGVNAYMDDRVAHFLEPFLAEYQATNYQAIYNGDGSLLHAMRGFTHVMFEYMDLTYEVIDEHLLDEFKGAIVKAYAIQAGTHLSHCYVQNDDNRAALSSVYQELTKGV